MPQPPTQQSQPEGGAGAASQLRSDAQQLGSSAADRVHSEVDARKGQAADQVRSVSSAVQKAVGDLDGGSPEWLKSALRRAGDQIQQFADAIDHKDSRQLLNDVQDFARSNPATFLGACAAAGFAAARIFKAGAEKQSDGAPQSSNQGRGYGDNSPNGGSAMFQSSTSDRSDVPNVRGEFA